MKKLLQLGVLALLTASAFAADNPAPDACASTAATVVAPCVATLANGFEIRTVRRETDGTNVKLYVSEISYTELPASQIAGYQLDPTPIATPAPWPAPQVSVEEHIARAGDANGVDPDFIKSVIKAESASNPKAVSPKGAQGLMQLMPATASKLGVKDSFDPAQNIDGGSKYLRDLLVQYRGDAAKALAAYNAGPHRVEQYKGVPPYRETRLYVAKVIRDYNRRKAATKPRQSATRSSDVTPPATNKGE